MMLRYWWEEGETDMAWRGRIKNLDSGEEVGFTDVESCIEYLRTCFLQGDEFGQSDKTGKA